MPTTTTPSTTSRSIMAGGLPEEEGPHRSQEEAEEAEEEEEALRSEEGEGHWHLACPRRHFLADSSSSSRGVGRRGLVLPAVVAT